MEKRNLYITTGILFFALIVQLYFTGAFVSLQGRFSLSPTTINQGVTYSLSASSPAGSRSVDVSDTIFIFDASVEPSILSETTFLRLGTTFEFEFETTGAAAGLFDTDGLLLQLYHEGNFVGETAFGKIVGDEIAEEDCIHLEEDTWSCITWAEISLDQRIQLGIGVETFEVQTDTSTLLDEDFGEDDPLDITMTVGGQTVAGNTLNY